MPKQKTHKGISKRVKVTAKGKIRYKKAGAGHLMSVKTSKRRRKISTPGALDNAFSVKMRRAVDIG